MPNENMRYRDADAHSLAQCKEKHSNIFRTRKKYTHAVMWLKVIIIIIIILLFEFARVHAY